MASAKSVRSKFLPHFSTKRRLDIVGRGAKAATAKWPAPARRTKPSDRADNNLHVGKLEQRMTELERNLKTVCVCLCVCVCVCLCLCLCPWLWLCECLWLWLWLWLCACVCWHGDSATG